MCYCVKLTKHWNVWKLKILNKQKGLNMPVNENKTHFKEDIPLGLGCSPPWS